MNSQHLTFDPQGSYLAPKQGCIKYYLSCIQLFQSWTVLHSAEIETLQNAPKGAMGNLIHHQTQTQDTKDPGLMCYVLWVMCSVLLLWVMCNVLCIICYVLYVMCHVLWVKCYVLFFCVMFYELCVMCYLLCLMYYVLCLMCYVLWVMSYVLCLMSHI